MSAPHSPRLRLPDRPPLSSERLRLLIEAAQRGDEAARSEVVEANLRLVLSIVHRFQGRADPDDLFQAGCVGLLRAVDRFDPGYGVAFSTFAVPLILGEIREHLRREQPLKVGRSLLGLGHKARQVKEELTQELGRSPTPAEVAGRMGVAPEDVVMALEALKPAKSLDEPLSESDPGARELGELIASEPDAPQRLESLALAQLLAALRPEERAFIRARYFERLSQTELAARIGRSQAYVSRLERRILLRLRRMWGE